MQPVLNLDFDGVLHPQGTIALDDGFRILEDNPLRFYRRPILERLPAPAHEVRVLVGFDWRYFCDDAAPIHFLGALEHRVDGTTPLCSGAVRADEILTDAARRGCERWLALDDHESVKLSARTDRRFVCGPPSTGVRRRAVRKRLSARLASGYGGRIEEHTT